MFYMDGAIGLTFTLLLITTAALIVVVYLEQRTQTCGADVFVLRLYSTEISRLWREAWLALLCL